MVADYAWVGVIRMAPVCQGSGSCDGLCEGWNGQRDPYYDHYNITARAVNAGLLNASVDVSSAPLNYGCWFYTFWNASAYSGAYVNVGRSLRVKGRCAVHLLLYGSGRSGNALCTTNPGDKLWCTFARAMGYDSIQIERGTAYYGNPRSRSWHGHRRPWSELVLCSDECATTRFDSIAMVPAVRSISPDGRVGPCAIAESSKDLICDESKAHSNMSSCAGLANSVHFHGTVHPEIDQRPPKWRNPLNCTGTATSAAHNMAHTL